jgi:hypothetical protein
VTTTYVDRLYDEFTALLKHLEGSGEVSLISSVDENFKKSLLLAAASLFEAEITAAVLNYYHEVVDGNTLIPSIVKIKAVTRQYHTWFAWERNNANQFIALFGDDFKLYMKNFIEENELEIPIRNFMEIGRDRNRLVHENFASFSLEKTAEEIFNSYRSAYQFVRLVPKALKYCTCSTTAG